MSEDCLHLSVSTPFRQVVSQIVEIPIISCVQARRKRATSVAGDVLRARRRLLRRHADQDGRRETWGLGRCRCRGDQLQGKFFFFFIFLSFFGQVGPLGFMCLDTDEAAGNMGMLDQGIEEQTKIVEA